MPYVSHTRVPMQLGRVPLRLLKETSNCNSDCRLQKEDGNEPDMKFPLKFRYLWGRRRITVSHQSHTCCSV